MSASFTSVSERINSIQAISLPPTPSDLEKVELVQRSLVLIKQATDDIMTAASSHAYALSGIPEAVERDLAQRIAGTATLCRRCEHCLSQCNPRAIAAMTSRDLVAETAQFKAQFEAVAHAAKTALAQVRAAASVSSLGGGANGVGGGAAAASSQQAAWQELFALETASDRADARAAEQQQIAARLAELEGIKEAIKQAVDVEDFKTAANLQIELKKLQEELSTANAARSSSSSSQPASAQPASARALVPAREAREAREAWPPRARSDASGPAHLSSQPKLQPSLIPELQPASAALSLWEARTQEQSGRGAVLGAAVGRGGGGGGMAAAGSAEVDSHDGAFAELAARSAQRPAAVGAMPGAQESAPSALANEVNDALEIVRRVTAQMHQVVAAHVWAGFTDEAEAEVRRLQQEGRVAARSCRRLLARALANRDANRDAIRGTQRQSEASSWWDGKQQAPCAAESLNEEVEVEARSAEVEAAIRDFSTVVEMANHTIGQHGQRENVPNQAAPNTAPKAAGDDDDAADADAALDAALARAGFVLAVMNSPNSPMQAGAPPLSRLAPPPARRPPPPPPPPPPPLSPPPPPAIAAVPSARGSAPTTAHRGSAPSAAAPPAAAPPPTRNVLVQQHFQQQAMAQVGNISMAQAIETNEALIEEGQAALRAVAAEVQEISAAFLDLGTLVARQADDVHRATTLADEATADVARAREELQQLEREQQEGGCSVQ
jgi:hypothetical protein